MALTQRWRQHSSVQVIRHTTFISFIHHVHHVLGAVSLPIANKVQLLNCRVQFLSMYCIDFYKSVQHIFNRHMMKFMAAVTVQREKEKTLRGRVSGFLQDVL